MSKPQSHEVIAKIKEFAANNDGLAPTIDQLALMGISARQVRNVFGAHSVAVQAAGLKPLTNGSDKKRSQLIAEAATRDLEADLIPNPVDDLNIVTKGNRMIFVPDLHAPWICKEALKKLIEYIEILKPSLVCQMGDAYDFFSFSRFTKTLNLYTPKQEVEVGKKQLLDFWDQVRKAAPKAELIQILGNHCERPLKTLFTKAPELEIFFDIKPWFIFAGVQTIFDPRQIVMINKEIEVTHGHWAKPMDYALSRRHNVVHGHTHRGGITYATLPDKRVIWEASGGHMSNNESVPMSYTPKENQNWQKGFIAVDDSGPRFVQCA